MKCPRACIVHNMVYVTTFAVVWIEIFYRQLMMIIKYVTTFAVVWIEMANPCIKSGIQDVTTFAVVWIEIWQITEGAEENARSPPSRWCGLKYRNFLSPQW